VLTNRLINNVYASSVRNLAGDSHEVFGRVIDDVITSEISGDLVLGVGTNCADHSIPQTACPRAKAMAHATSRCVDENKISRLHPVRSMQEILRSHSLQD